MRLDTNGYERGKNDTYVHRSIAEKVLGRPLKSTEIVHHIDGNKANNINNNLLICPTQEYHKLIHARQSCISAGYSPEKYHYCSYHKQYEEKERFSFRNSWNGLHNMCREATNLYRQEKGLNINKFNWVARMAQQYRRANRKGLVSCLSKEGRGL